MAVAPPGYVEGSVVDGKPYLWWTPVINADSYTVARKIVELDQWGQEIESDWEGQGILYDTFFHDFEVNSATYVGESTPQSGPYAGYYVVARAAATVSAPSTFHYFAVP